MGRFHPAVQSRVVYLDNNATTRPSDGVVRAVQLGLQECWHNPSSVHRAGQAARQHVELARRDVAALIGAKPREIVFTSGGTEAIDLSIRSALGGEKPGDPPVLVTTRVEHAAIRELADSLEKAGLARVRYAATDRAGAVVLAELEALLAGAAVCSVQWANNETGVVQPVAEIASLCEKHRVRFHCDATQWVGKMPTPAPFGDYLTFAPHKFHGPKGVGVLWSKRGAPIRPAIHGTQELGRRGGTENVPGILGAGSAAREALEWLGNAAERERLGKLRDRFEAGVLAGCRGAVVNSAGAPRLWNTTNIAFPRLEAEAILLMLSERGVCASAGAACSSGSLDPSPVLLAMGVPPELAHGSVRFSLSRHTTQSEIEEATDTVTDCIRTLYASLPGS
jgi:cysteine desulfurase